MDVYIKFLPLIVNKLDYLSKSQIKTTFDQNLQPLGIWKLKLIEMITITIKLNHFEFI